MKRRPLPPFAKRLTEYHRKDFAMVAIGPWAWQRAKADPRFLVLPEGRDPHEFSWPVAGREIFLMELGAFDTDRLERTAQALLLAGARRIVAYRAALHRDLRHEPIIVYAPDEAAASAA